jgi:hypothetical protein
MRILRTIVLGVAGFATVTSLTVLSVNGQTKGGAGMMDHKMSMSGKTMTNEEKIANALTAAPASVAAKATIADWPAKEGEAPAVLRAGSNEWTCLPDMPDTQGNDPVCLDKPWMTWVAAYLAHKAPQVGAVGIGYMAAPGGAWESNSDPYATAKTADNHWSHHPPHLMIVVPDLKSLQGLSTDPNSGGPYVMFAGTPYAHIMAPLAAGTMMGKEK